MKKVLIFIGVGLGVITISGAALVYTVFKRNGVL